MSKRYVVEEKKERSGWGVVIAAGFMLAYPKALIVLALGFSAAYLLIKYAKHRAARDELKRSNAAALSAQADREHRMYLLEGDIYGQYQPVTMPMTQARRYV